MEQNNYSHDAGRGRRPRWKPLQIVGFVIAGVAFACLVALLFGFVVKWLWNWLMPDIFGLPPISYWQAFGLIILAKLFFGGLGHHRSDSHRDKFKRWASSDSNDRWRPYDRFWRERGDRAAEDLIGRARTERPSFDEEKEGA